jgi:hypothetical protein
MEELVGEVLYGDFALEMISDTFIDDIFSFACLLS